MATEILKLLEGLGLCEYCGILLSVEDMPGDAMDSVWCCPQCAGIISGLSFGYEGEGEATKKVKWVGPGGMWASEKPTKDFKVGSWSIQVAYMPISRAY
jgi:hypothetical protein